MIQPLSKPQTEILDFLRGYISENGFSPSIRDIVGGTSLRSTQHVRYHLLSLETKGLISRVPNRARTIQIVEQANV